MARARLLKPGFFKNEDLWEVPFEARLLFAGLWCLADKRGRLEDRPRRIKAEIFPADEVEVDKQLSTLAAHHFLCRYEVGGERYIQIVNFEKHQKPHPRESESVIPDPQSNAKVRPRRAKDTPRRPEAIPSGSSFPSEAESSKALSAAAVPRHAFAAPLNFSALETSKAVRTQYA